MSISLSNDINALTKAVQVLSARISVVEDRLAMAKLTAEMNDLVKDSECSDPCINPFCPAHSKTKRPRLSLPK